MLACCPALKREQANAESLDQRMAYSILSRAMEEPARAILSNAGYDAAPILGQMTEAGTAFDACSGSIVDAARAGLFDSAGVLLSAVRGAVSSAALALTIDVLFHYPNPKTSVNP
jgi:chaperonin GroEL